MLETVIRVRASCDGCGDGWILNGDDDRLTGVDPVFADEGAARAALEAMGWLLEGARTVCGTCRVRRVCDRVGHLPDEAGPGAEAPTYCRRCGDFLPGAAPHDAAAAPLSEAEAAALVALELDLGFGEEE